MPPAGPIVGGVDTKDAPVDVILPCLDEAAALPGVLAGFPPGYRPIVVDNGSTDGSPDVAASHGARVVREGQRGYGAAVHAGILASETDIVCVLDADGSLDPAELPALVGPVAEGTVDLAVGRRIAHARSAWPWHARLGNAVLAALLRRRGLEVHDIAPMRAARRERLLALGIQDRAFGYPLELLIRARQEHLRLLEVEVTYRPRTAGTRSKVSGSVTGTMRAVRDMAAVLNRVTP